MAGLGIPAQQGMQQRQPMQQPMQQEEQSGGGQQASAKEQASYEEFAQTLTDVIYPQDTPGQVFPQVLSNLQGQFDPQVIGLFDGCEPALTNSPQDSVAATSVLVTLVVDKKMGLLDQALSAEGQSMQPDEGQSSFGAEGDGDYSPEAVLMEGGKLAVEELIEVAEAANIHDFTQEEIDGAFYRALDLFRVAQEKVNPRVVQSLQRGFEQLRMAEQKGELNKVLPGLPGGAPMKQGA